jgi:hypothetical protein
MQLSRLQRADIDDHVDFSRTIEDGSSCLVLLRVCSRGAKWKSHDGTDCYPTPPQQAGTGGDPGWVHADAGESELRRLAAERLDLGLRRVGLQQRMVDHRRHVARATTGRMEPESGCPRLYNRGNSAGTAFIENRVTGTPYGCTNGITSGQLLDNDLNETLEVDRHQLRG